MFEREWPQTEFHAMGGQISLWLDIDDRREAEELFNQAKAIFGEVEQALSRFKPDSELSRLNSSAGRWVPVSSLLWDVLALALEYSKSTGGIFDPTVAPALKQAGYDRSFEQIQREGASVNSSQVTVVGGFQQVGIANDQRAVYLPEGFEIDLGGIAKGYTVRRAAEKLGQFGPALVDGSGDIMAAGKPEDLPGWPVGIAFPNGSDDPDLAFVWLDGQALATSGIDRRHWGPSDHHIIDPFTHLPAETKAVTATILSDDIVAADVYATVCLIGGEASIPGSLALLTVNDRRDVHMNPNMANKLAWVSPLVNLI
jgi:thiamine biosynthesis lipoprotein